MKLIMKLIMKLTLLIAGYVLLIFAAADLAGWACRPLDLQAPFNRNAAIIVLLTGFGAGMIGLAYKEK